LVNYAWPGNIRELANVIERAKILADDSVITPQLLPDNLTRPMPATARASGTATPPPSLPERLGELERDHVLAILEREGGNKSRAAAALGLTRRSLYRLLEKYGLGHEH
jgi:DNA-binding NtrC family response regulator